MKNNIIGTIKRIFHPIGQGAFYSEHFNDEKGGKFNIVYDCGGQIERLKDSIIDTFNKKDEIDMVFISHFHKDHICGLPLLKDYYIKRVLLPVLDDIINKIYVFVDLLGNTSDETILDFALQLIFTPQEYFGSDTVIMYLGEEQGSDELSQLIDIETIVPSDEDNTIITKINNGTGVYFKQICPKWKYQIHHNVKAMSKKKDLKTALDAIVDTSDEQAVISMLKSESGLDQIKKCFKNIYGNNINQTSVLVYSGPCFDNTKRDNEIIFSHNKAFLDSLGFATNISIGDLYFRVGCVYTGDYQSDKEDKLSNVFNDKTKWENIGVIQIPHHGAKTHFDKSKILIDSKSYICPISYGNNNLYHHPSEKVLADIIAAESIPKHITDNKESIFIEIIKIENKT